MADLSGILPFLRGTEVPESRYEQKTVEDELEEYSGAFSLSEELVEHVDERDYSVSTREKVEKYGPAVLDGAVLGTVALIGIGYAVDPEFQYFINHLPQYLP